MNPKRSLEWIKDFEGRCGHLNYTISGVDCWPIIRNTLLSMVLPKSSQSAGVGSRIANGKFVDILKAFRDFFSFKKADVFILTDSKFSAEISGLVYLKDSHVIKEQAGIDSETSIIALQNLSINDAIVGRERCLSIFAVLLLSAGLSRFSFFIRYIPDLSRYIERLCGDLVDAPVLNDGSVSSKKLKGQIYKNILFCLVASKLFAFVLGRVRPKRAYVVCYYSILGMALCAACRRLGISITDIQHGVAGSNMRAYAGWVNVPRQGYTTLPDRFFCWTEFDARAIADWAQHTARHKAVVVGSLWRDYVIENSLLSAAEEQWAPFFQGLSAYEKKVLITMQSSRLAQLFVDVVKQAKPSYCFLIRMHPGFSLDKDDNYSDLVQNYANVFFEQPSKMPLQVLMKHVDVHLTEWSGAVIDAHFEGVKSVVVSEGALDYFEDFIAKGDVVYAPALKEIQHVLSL